MVNACALAATLLVSVARNDTLFGDCSIGLDAALLDPILVVGSDVYKPLEVFGVKSSGPVWTLDETAVYDRQMLTPVGGAYSVRGSEGVNSATPVLTRAQGIMGNCSIIAYNAARGPAQAAWSSLLEEDCDNVNLVTDWVNAAMSTDGSLVAATSVVFENTLATVLVASYDGQTGVENWRRRWRAPDETASPYWANRGIAVSADGRWVATAVGDWSGPVPLLVLDAITGEPRSAAPMPTCDVVAEPQISADGSLVLVKDADGSASLFHWDTKTSAYLQLGLLKPPNPGSWSVVATTFGSAPTPLGFKPTVAIAWISKSIMYAQFAMFEVVGEGITLLSSWMSAGSTKYAVDDASVSCWGNLCAGGFERGDDVAASTVVVLSAAAGCTGSVFEFATGGSVKSVQLAPGPDASTTYLAASGCSTPSVCTGPGGNAFMWKLTA